VAAGDSAPLGGPPDGSPEVNRATAGRRNIGLILSLLGMAALLILAALLMRGSANVTARNATPAHHGAPASAAPGGAGPSPGP
jgi:hypothetical protein